MGLKLQSRHGSGNNQSLHLGSQGCNLPGASRRPTVAYWTLWASLLHWPRLAGINPCWTLPPQGEPHFLLPPRPASDFLLAPGSGRCGGCAHSGGSSPGSPCHPRGAGLALCGCAGGEHGGSPHWRRRSRYGGSTGLCSLWVRAGTAAAHGAGGRGSEPVYLLKSMSQCPVVSLLACASSWDLVSCLSPSSLFQYPLFTHWHHSSILH